MASSFESDIKYSLEVPVMLPKANLQKESTGWISKFARYEGLTESLLKSPNRSRYFAENVISTRYDITQDKIRCLGASFFWIVVQIEQ